jgi:hypothetical protein
MKDQGLLFLSYETKTRPLHYIVLGKEVVFLTTKQSNKVKYMEKSKDVKVKFNNPIAKVNEKKAKVVVDKEYIKQVFNEMLNRKNTHFKDFSDDLVAVVLT